MKQDEFVEEAMKQFDFLYPTATWDRENGEHLIVNPTLHRAHKEKLRVFLLDILERHKSRILEEVVSGVEKMKKVVKTESLGPVTMTFSVDENAEALPYNQAIDDIIKSINNLV